MNNRLKNSTRLVLVLCGLGLIAVLFVPLWTIDLIAPQYPEGLALIIYPHGLGGNVDIINGLNHYIGMKTLHTEDFMEFKILPYIIGAFAGLFILVGLIGRKKLMYGLVTLYIIFGVVAMVDFYLWEYDYGHNLDPSAAIKVPGMAYQPPLIGYKQLLNFSAYSIPAAGGWIFIGVGLVALVFSILETKKYHSWRASRAIKKQAKHAVLALFAFTFISCSTQPEPIKVGKDNCEFCKMTISDARFGAEVVTKKGKVFKFDDSHCVLAFLKAKTVAEDNLAAVYFSNFEGNNELINANDAFYLKSEELKSPMGGNIAAFSNKEAMQQMANRFNGTETSWGQLKP